MAETFKVLVEGQFVGTASSVSQGEQLAHQMAFRMGHRGGGIKMEIFDEQNNRRGGGTITVG